MAGRALQVTTGHPLHPAFQLQIRQLPGQLLHGQAGTRLQHIHGIEPRGQMLQQGGLRRVFADTACLHTAPEIPKGPKDIVHGFQPAGPITQQLVAPLAERIMNAARDGKDLTALIIRLRMGNWDGSGAEPGENSVTTAPPPSTI